MYRSTTHLALLLLTALLTVSCGDDDPVFIAPPAPPQIDESFDGTLTPFSARTHFFQAQNPGEIIAQISAITPDTTIVGISIGTGNGFACQAAVSTEQAGLNSGLIGVANAPGVLCIRVYDPSNEGLPAAITYSIRVRHY